MEIYLLIGLIFIVIILARIVFTHSSNTKKVFKNNAYSYSAKSLIMTRAEAEFFIRLNRIVEERYFVFPQVHLSALLNHKIKGQDWHYAFRHTNGKSVDLYYAINKPSGQPTRSNLMIKPMKLKSGACAMLKLSGFSKKPICRSCDLRIRM